MFILAYTYTLDMDEKNNMPVEIQSGVANYNKELHSQLLSIGHGIERGVSHKLESPFIDSIMTTLDFFGASQSQLGMVSFDLKRAKYKIFDWLGMCYTGRLNDPNNPSNKNVFETIEKMVKLYVLQKHVGGFAWFLRGHDLQIEDPIRCEDCIKSYDSWRAEQ